ncbi:hypothetical protein BJH93_08555 [Kocuria polaris]|nr:hypothetical protein [Kocuria polaris]
MSLTAEATTIAQQAHAAAAASASRSGVRLADEHDRDRLRDVEALLVSIWGMSPQGAPIPFDLLRSISHAQCNVSVAYDASETLRGAAVGIVTGDGRALYSLIAGVRPGAADRGVGFAVKQHQRAWALERGIDTMTWTFDPLVSRNARFNLTKLGAEATEYARDFYGAMQDGINAHDESDRLVATWKLGTGRSRDCAEGRYLEVNLPDATVHRVTSTGPDGLPLSFEAEGALWCRTPHDVVALRSADLGAARAWRQQVREVLEAAFAAGYRATGVTRTGWYRLAQDNPA